MTTGFEKAQVVQTPPSGRGLRILVIQQKMIGDVLTSSILFEALRKHYPKASLHYLIYPHTLPVVENNPFIDQIITYKEKAGFWSYLQKIRRMEYSIVIDVYAKIGTALITKASAAEKRISYKKWYTSPLYSHTVKRKKKPVTPAGLAIENRMLLLKALSPNFPEAIKPKIYLTETEKIAAKQRLQKAVLPDNPVLMIGVLGSSEEKTYPLPYMAEILNFIAENSETTLLFNYMPSQKEKVEELFGLCNAKTQEQIRLDIFGKSLREFLALTSQCKALIGNEGGAVNMAKALNVPTFSIFSPQINKAAWSVYEHDKNMAVHLRDFKPKAFQNKTNHTLYQDFSPQFITPNLHKFLKYCELI